MTTTLVVGATGKTGLPLVELLLGLGHEVRVIVRSPAKFGAELVRNPNMKVVEASVLDVTDDEMLQHLKGCDAVVSCLGHTVDFHGMFGQPRKLCTETIQRLCDAINRHSPFKPTKLILMNTVGVGNADLNERRSWFERLLLTLLRYAVPPHRDNETAAEYLHKNVGRENAQIEWCIVRPDSLIDAEISSYEIMESPTTGIFSGRPTTRSNVAQFMAELIDDAGLWSAWKFRMPVIMDVKETV